MKQKLSSSFFISLAWALVLHAQVSVVLGNPSHYDNYANYETSTASPDYEGEVAEVQEKPEIPLTEDQKFKEKLLEVSEDAIQDFSSNSHRIQSRLSLYTLEKILPVAQGLRSNLSLALNVKHPDSASANPSKGVSGDDHQVSEEKLNHIESLSTFEELDAQLRGIETELSGNRDSVSRISRLLNSNLVELQEQINNVLDNRFPDPESESASESGSSEPSSACGGLIDVSGQSELLLSRLGRRTQPCIWILWSSRYSGFSVKLTNMSKPSSSSSTTLSLHWGFTENVPRNRTIATRGQTLEFTGPVVLVQSKSISKSNSKRSKSNSMSRRASNSQESFSLRFSTTGSGSGPQGRVTYYPDLTRDTEVNSGNEATRVTEFKHPAHGGQYRDNERTFFTLFPSRGTKPSLRVMKVDTEGCCDYLNILKFNQEDNVFQFLTREAGGNRQGLLGSYIGNVNSPILMYFHSDGGSTRTGFALTFQS